VRYLDRPAGFPILTHLPDAALSLPPAATDIRRPTTSHRCRKRAAHALVGPVSGDQSVRLDDRGALGCDGGTSNGYFCNSRLDGQMRTALRLERRAPERATELWTAIDHRLTDDAPWVPTVNLREVDLVSSRLRNYLYNPVWGFLPDQSWIG
jgi:hypothetical protein